jgi:hypothetical protein
VFGYEICFGLLLSFVWLFIFPPFIHSAFRLCRARKESSLSSALLHLKLFLLALGWNDRKQEILMANIAMTIIYNGENYISVPFTMRKAARHQTSWKVFFSSLKGLLLKNHGAQIFRADGARVGR